MQNPQMPNVPGAGAMTDTLDFVKNLWGSMGVPGLNLPGLTAPALSVDELDKKIADLKAVESWLNLNLTMLRGTIQAMEVQRGTIATLKSMGATLANAVKQPGADEKSVLAAAPFASHFFAPPAPEPAAAQPAPGPEAKAGGRDAPAEVPAMANPIAWWNMLQDQFTQAVSTAMSPEAIAGAAAMAQDAAARMSAASAEQASRLGKAMEQAPAAVKPEAEQDEPPGKARAARPKAGKSGA